MFSLIWITYYTWFKSWHNFIRIRIYTWFKSWFKIWIFMFLIQYISLIWLQSYPLLMNWSTMVFWPIFMHYLKHLYKSFSSLPHNLLLDYHFSFLTTIMRMIIVMIIISLRVFIKCLKPTFKEHLFTSIFFIWTLLQPLARLTSLFLVNS